MSVPAGAAVPSTVLIVAHTHLVPSVLLWMTTLRPTMLCAPLTGSVVVSVHSRSTLALPPSGPNFPDRSPTSHADGVAGLHAAV